MPRPAKQRDQPLLVKRSELISPIPPVTVICQLSLMFSPLLLLPSIKKSLFYSINWWSCTRNKSGHYYHLLTSTPPNCFSHHFLHEEEWADAMKISAVLLLPLKPWGVQGHGGMLECLHWENRVIQPDDCFRTESSRLKRPSLFWRVGLPSKSGHYYHLLMSTPIITS